MKALRILGEWIVIVIALMIGFGGGALILVKVDPVYSLKPVQHMRVRCERYRRRNRILAGLVADRHEAAFVQARQ
jgi:hypothetical protein